MATETMAYSDLWDSAGNPIRDAWQRLFDAGQFLLMLSWFCHEGGGEDAPGHLCSYGLPKSALGPKDDSPVFVGERTDTDYDPTPEEYGRAILARIDAGWCGC